MPEDLPSEFERLKAEFEQQLRAKLDRRVAEIAETHAVLLEQYKALAAWVDGLCTEWPTASQDFLRAFASLIRQGLVPRLKGAFDETQRELLAIGRPPIERRED